MNITCEFLMKITDPVCRYFAVLGMLVEERVDLLDPEAIFGESVVDKERVIKFIKEQLFPEPHPVGLKEWYDSRIKTLVEKVEEVML